jgi:hypothetical protein
MAVRWSRHVATFAAFQVGDAIACAIPLDYIRRDLDNIDCPDSIRRALPPIKAVSAAGLLLGLHSPRIGRITAFSLVAYFLAAIGFHVRAKDSAWKAMPAASLAVTSAVIGLAAYRVGSDERTPDLAREL